MAEETTGNDLPKKTDPTIKPKDGTNKNSKLSEWFINIKGEFQKILWPSKHELLKKTTTVIITSVILGALIVLYDGVFSVAMKAFANYLAK